MDISASAAVSVIVPTYRREDSLRRTLDSLAVQTCRDLEILLVDDNGLEIWNHKVLDIVQDFRFRHPNIPLHLTVNPQNLGPAKARNVAIRQAKGQYVTFLDDDDVYLPEKISQQLEFMEQGGFDYSITDLCLYSQWGTLVSRRTRGYIQSTDPEALHRYHLCYHMTGTDTLMFRRDYLQSIGGFPPVDLGEEFYLMERAIQGGGRFGYLPECHIRAYVHTGQGGMSSGKGKIQGENALFAYKKRYFPQLQARQRRYIRMRHYAVLAFAYLRMGYLPHSLVNGALAFLSAPTAFFRLLLGKDETA